MLQRNRFILNQTLDTVAADGLEYFTVHGKHFLMVANRFYNKRNSVYVLYRWETGTFKEIQRITPFNGFQNGMHFFTINTRNFMSFANYGSNQVSIYEWKNETFGNKTQNISIKSPTKCSTFTINTITYIACGSSVQSSATTVLKWSGNRFQLHHNLPSMYVEGHLHSFKANSIDYLAIANYCKAERNNFVFDIDSYIYRWNGNVFVLHQSIPTHGALDCDSFMTSDGEVFLIVANSQTNSGAKFNVKSAVYNMANNKFNLYQQLPTAQAVNVHAFRHKGKQYLAVVSHIGGKSAVYIWK